MFKEEIESAGFSLRTTKRTIGAVIGTQFHSRAAAVLKARMEGCTDFEQLAKLADGISCDYNEEPTEWDATTGDAAAADLALTKIVRAWLPTGLAIEPRLVEQKMEKDLGNGFVLSGHIDVATKENVIRDHKTGAQKPEPQAQLGGYGILFEHKYNESVSGLVADWVKRVGKTKPQEAPKVLVFDVGECKSAANRVLDQAMDDLEAFRKSGNPWEFMANPQTMMCGEKYCTAFNTPFCKMGG
jgi:hypothetical protein